MNNISTISKLGVGLSFRSHFSGDVFQYRDNIDFIEIIADHYIDCSSEKLSELKLLLKYFTVIPHAINLSLGSAEGIDKVYLKKLGKLLNLIQPPYWSEHISFTKVAGIEIGHLSPLPFTDQSIQTLVSNITLVQEEIKYPLILENISYLVKIPVNEMTEGEFLTKLFSKLDCGLLLDLTNLYYNAQNHSYDLDLFLKTIPLDKVVQCHFTGGRYDNGKYIDNHSAKTPNEVWDVMNKTLSASKVKGLILERDDSNPDFKDILNDLLQAKCIFSKWN